MKLYEIPSHGQNMDGKEAEANGEGTDAGACDADPPAVDHHGPGVGQRLGLDPPDEAQQAGGVVGNAVVGPAREVELSDLPDLVGPPLKNRVTAFQSAICLKVHWAKFGLIRFFVSW